MCIKYGHNENIMKKIEHNEKDPKFKVGDRVRFPKYKNVFVKRLHCSLV